MTGQTFKLRILHISDLHERGDREPESWRKRRVLGPAWESNLDEIAGDGPLDLVCFTGDIADRGLEAEYKRAADFFQAAMERLNIPPDNFFLVPGNHDIHRPTAKNAWEKLRENLDRVDPLDISRWLAGGEAPLGFDNRERDDVLSRQAAYREWMAEELQKPDLLPDPALHPHLGYRRTLRLPDRPFDIHIIGLDSAWLCGDDNDAGRLRLTDDQVMRLTSGLGGNPLTGFRLALVHHPLGHLAEGADCRRLLAEQVDLLLRGHLHEPEPGAWADPARTLRQLAAGCLYEGHRADRFPNACHVLEITLDEQGRPQRCDIRFRGWSPRGHWFDDNSLYPGTENGRLCWHITPPPAPSPPHPRVRDVFAGRGPELECLARRLLPSGGDVRPVAVCSLQGMPGVGKSYLVDRFYLDHEHDFPGGYLRLSLDPRQTATADALSERLLDLLEMPPAGSEAAAWIRNRLNRPRTLLHIENADSNETAAAAAELVNRLPECPVAVSGRFHGLGAAAGWEVVPIAPFDEKTALDQLFQELEAPLTEEHKDLVRTLGCLPLAIHLAAGHLRAGRGVSGFLHKLRQSGWELPPCDPAEPLLNMDRTRALLSATFTLSLDLLQSSLLGDTALLLDAFRALGHAPAEGFGLSLGAALAGLPETDFEELLIQAFSLSLIERLPGDIPDHYVWRVHPLLAEWLGLAIDESVVIERMTDWFIARLPKLPGARKPPGRNRKGQLELCHNKRPFPGMVRLL